MARFIDLNEDVLTLLLSHLQDHRPTLHALALTCSLLSRIATTLLYRTVDVSLGYSQPDIRFDRLLRTLNQPNKRRGLQLTSYIRNVHIAWDSNHKVMRHPDTIEFLHTIHKTRKLSLFVKRLSIYRQYGLRPLTQAELDSWDSFRRADLSFWDLSKLPHLRELELDFTNPSQDLARFMCITPVDCITVKTDEAEIPDTFSSHSLRRRRKPLTKLRLYTHYSYQSLTNILVASGGIKHLELFEPGTLSGETTTIYIDDLIFIMSTTYSPQSLTLALEPLHQTLETLDITSRNMAHWPHHDSTRLDLRPFVHLTRAIVDSKCFFPPSTGPAHREDPTPLLPCHLASLTVAFDTSTTALGPSGSSYQWLLALAQNAPRRLRCLRTVQILEQKQQGRAFCQVCDPVVGIFDWDPPADAQRILSSVADVLEVQVKLRVWGRQDPDDDEEGIPGVPRSVAGGPPVRVPPRKPFLE